MGAVAEAVPVAELVALFAGTELTAPFMSTTLGVEICRRVQPRTVTDLRRAVFGDWAPGSIPTHGLCVLAVAFTDWINETR